MVEGSRFRVYGFGFGVLCILDSHFWGFWGFWASRALNGMSARWVRGDFGRLRKLKPAFGFRVSGFGLRNTETASPKRLHRRFRESGTTSVTASGEFTQKKRLSGL